MGGQANAGGESAAGGQSVAGSSAVEAGASAGGSGGRGGSTGVAGGGASSLGGGAGAGASGAPSVSTGGMGMLSGVCAGAFKEPAPQILLGASPPSNLSITGDELELFFNSDNVIFSHRRASTGVLFPEATPVAGLNAVCGAQVVGGMDVTLDGLRLYIACSDDAGGFTGPLRLATRADRQSPFVLSADELGTVGNSISISQDELTLYGVTQPGSMGYTLVYERQSLDDPFGPGQLVMGLGGPFSFPEISPDGLNLFGGTGLGNEGLAVASRATPAGDFSAPTHTGFPAPAGGLLQFTPTVSQDCRLYYLNFGASSVSNSVNLLPH
ncbi:MAG TPA: hypothetical protein VHP33_08545 [Polyangiaceae bacterium]|nr:hypothetical protein [Polyangiaceae bacterium]